MAVQNKFNDFVEQLERGVHNFGTHTFKVALTNTLPVATNSVLADITQIAAGNGYVAGGSTTTVTISETGGVSTVQGTSVVFTAVGGSIGPFRYAVLYNDTPTSPADPLISWSDYGSSITLLTGETFTVLFNNATPGTIHTVT